MIQNIEANGVSTAFTRIGKGPPLILLHGAEADHSMFDTFGKSLSAQFSVIALDQRDSGGTKNPTTAYGFDDLADDVAEVIKALGWERAHVFGTSFGGAIAQVLAVRHPKRVDRLVLSSTFRIGMSLAEINPESAPRIAELRGKLPASLLELATYFFPEEYIQANPDSLKLFTGSKRTEDQKKRRGAVVSKSVIYNLGDIGATTLVLAGDKDRLIPAKHTLSLANDIGHSRTVLVSGIGHVGVIQAPALIASEVRSFLQSR